ncbi:MAG: hypothetical protein KGH95_06915, partial [Thaumarchaeota archaeon]|nr:hypothetical protein [Nitrososphaerota archaeon]
GINCNNYPPPTLSQIQFDKLNYEAQDKPVITIVGVPFTVTHLEIDDSSSNIIFEHDLNLPSNGTARYVLDISSYKSGEYSATATSLVSKITTSFTVGMPPSGGVMGLNVDKNSYLPGDRVSILGTGNSNTLIQLSLIDPSGTSIISTKIFSDKTGHFSSSNFTIPNNAITGIWQISATSGMMHVHVKIAVNSTLNNSSEIKNVKAITPSPLKQFKSGIATNDIKCVQGFQLVTKAEDGSPACVKPDTAYRLILKGWAKEFIQSVQATSSDLCGGIEVPSGNLRTGIVPVLMMKPNSTATVCVTYQFISDWDSYPNKNIYPHGIFETCCLVHMGKSSTVTSSNQFEVLANPPLFNVTGVYNESKITVMYMIHAGLDSSGFYDSSIPYGNCNSYPLAVGYDSPKIDASDFSYDMDIPCFNTIDKVDSVKIVSGMSYKEVAFR